MSLRVRPTTLEEANAFVKLHHRHHKPVTGQKFSCGLVDDGAGGKLVGVAIGGRPVAPDLDDGLAFEIYRNCTDGTRNACSMLYGAMRRAARALGHSPVITYSLPEEGGASLRAAGFVLDKENAGGPAHLWHNRPGRMVKPAGTDMIGGKWRWIG